MIQCTYMADKVLPAQPVVKESFTSGITKGLNSIGALAIIIALITALFGVVTALFLYNATKIDNLSSDVNQRFDRITTEINQRFEAMDKRLDNIEKAILILTHEIKNKQ